MFDKKSLDNFRSSKKLGQNFLKNKLIQQKIVECAQLEKNDIVLEIGPGMGAITSILLTNKIKLIAIEYDKRLFDYLQKKFQSYKNFILYSADALKIDWNDILQNFNNVKVVANLPYSISSKIILKILKQPKINSAVIMVQKEMADRIQAKVGTKNYNMFTILVQCFFKIENLFNVNPKNFYPVPKVESKVIKLVRYKTSEMFDFDLLEFQKFLKQCFLNKRKTLINNLLNFYPKHKIEECLINMNLCLTIRAEQLTNLQLIDIMKKIKYDKSL